MGKVRDIYYREKLGILNKRKVSTSLAANMVHSIDAAAATWVQNHLPEGVECAMVHDCYMGHPNDMDVIRDHVRLGFYEVTKEYPEGPFLWPERGELDSSEVSFFSSPL